MHDLGVIFKNRGHTVFKPQAVCLLNYRVFSVKKTNYVLHATLVGVLVSEINSMDEYSKAKRSDGFCVSLAIFIAFDLSLVPHLIVRFIEQLCQ